MTNAQSTARAGGGKQVRALLEGLGRELTLTFRGRGHKSSDGDGRTAADIERELAAQRQKET